MFIVTPGEYVKFRTVSGETVGRVIQLYGLGDTLRVKLCYKNKNTDRYESADRPIADIRYINVYSGEQIPMLDFEMEG